MDVLYEVYLLFSSGVNAYKIGVSKNSTKRVKKLQTGCPYQIEIVKLFKTSRPFKIEKALHNMYAQYKWNYDGDVISGEWFQLPINEVVEFENICNKIEKRIKILVDSGNPFV